MRKNFLWLLLIVLLILSVLGTLNVNMIGVSAVEEDEYIYIDPPETWNTSLVPGTNYTISIKMNHTGDDIWGWQFDLYYNPNVLHGGINKTDTWTAAGIIYFTTLKPVITDSEKVYVNGVLQTKGVHYLFTYETGQILFIIPPPPGVEVKAVYLYGIVNGDLITKNENTSARFTEGTFFNNLGGLSVTAAWFNYPPTPVPTTSVGEGEVRTLANITFKVVGYGVSDIILGDQTKLSGWNHTDTPPSIGKSYAIIDGSTTEGREHLLHGFFSNIPPTHDVAVSGLDAPATAAIEQPVPINVTVANEGTYDESVNLTVYNDTSVIDSTTFSLNKGFNNTVSFSWNTSGLTTGTYEINATATITVDDDLSDNNKTQTVELQLVHDVAVVSLVAPSSGAIEYPVPISVTVTNEGSYDESVDLTVYYDTSVIDSTTFLLAKGPTSNTFSCSWDTSGLTTGTYEINATATITVDDDLSDNNKTQTVELQLVHDVAVVSLVAPTYRTIEYPVPIDVTVTNEGSYDESVDLTVYYDTSVIDSTTFLLAKGGTSNTVSFSWNTSGLTTGTYEINATATITVDDDLSDNNKTKTITLMLVYDVKVVSIEVPLRGNVNDTVLFNVTVKNTGSFTETFNVTTYYDNTTIVLPNGKNYTTVTLARDETKTIPLTWNTTGVAHGFYAITANASKLENETNTGDNTLLSSQVLVTIPGDVDGNGAVDASDLSDLNQAYGSEPGDSNWDPYCDFDSDGKVDASDLYDLGKNYDKSVP